MIVAVHVYFPNGEVGVYPGCSIISTWNDRLKFKDRNGKEMITTLPYLAAEE